MDFNSAYRLNQQSVLDMSFLSYTLFWFRTNLSFLLLINTACLTERHQMPIVWCLVWPNMGSNLLSIAFRNEQANHCTTITDTVEICKVWRVWKYQRDNQNLYIEEELTTQWPKEKVQKDKQWSTKHTHKTKDWITRTSLKSGGELRWSGRVSSSCSTS
jgi:hypothetical protein